MLIDTIARVTRRAEVGNALPAYLVPGGLILIWLAVLLGIPALLPLHLASWATFIALLITPGYLLVEMLAWRLNLDLFERLAVAFSLGVAAMALPGLTTMLLHLTIEALVAGWTLTVGTIVLAWLVFSWYRRRALLEQPAQLPWAWDELVMLGLLVGAFIIMLPLLTLYKIDGDTYAFVAFTRDALSGQPLGLTEPYLGTDLGPGLRLAFNQFFPVSVLWSQLAQVDRIQLSATGTRAMIALWSILASYMIGKSAGGGNRRLGLFTALVQVTIYLAAPFLRADSVSSFFFNRISTDKFTVPIVMLPVIFALSLRFMREGVRQAWLVAALATAAVSAIHPLIAIMLALGLGALAGLHLLLNLRNRIAWRRTFGLGVLVAIVMVLPMVQFLLSRFDTPFAPTYPGSFEGWQVGEKMSPAFPFVLLRGLDQYGPLPALSEVDPASANTDASPFLKWRFGTNMRQQRVILFGINRYILDPTYVLEPPFVLAMLVLLLMLPRVRRSLAVQYVLSNWLAVLFVMYNPILTPKIGSMLVPWIMWRMIWLLPYALTIALGTYWLLEGVGRGLARLLRASTAGPARGGHGLRSPGSPQAASAAALLPLLGIVVAGLVLLPNIKRNIDNLNEQAVAARVFPTPRGIMDRLEHDTLHNGPATVMAEQALSVTIAAFVGKANIVAHRSLSTSEVFPADQQHLALQRLVDQDSFYRSRYLTDTQIDILKRYNVRYVVATSGTDLDMQLRLASQWFEWLLDDEAYTLYAVKAVPDVSESIQGNIAMQQRDWQQAQRLYQSALEQNPQDLIGLFGLAESYRVQGRFDEALQLLAQAGRYTTSIVLHYELGRLYLQTGDIERSIAELEQVQAAAPMVARFHMAMGDVCLSDGRVDCAREQYQAAVDIQYPLDEPSRLIAEGRIWLDQERSDLALPLYEKAAELRPSKSNLLLLANVYQELERPDRARDLLDSLQREAPADYDIMSARARLAVDDGQVDRALGLYDRAIWLQELVMRDTSLTRLAKAQALMADDRNEEARREIADVLNLQPYNGTAYTLLGNLYRDEQQPEMAVHAYQQALRLNPTEVLAYISLSDQYRVQATNTGDAVGLLERGTQANPEQASLFLTLGDQLQRRGDAQGAITAYQLGLELLEPNQSMRNARQRTNARTSALALSRLARVYEDLGDVHAAMNYFYAAASAAPSESWARVALGDALRRRNNPDAAEEIYRQTIKADPGSVEAYISLADLMSARGQADEVQALYDQALQVASADEDRREQARIWLGVGDRFSRSRRPELDSSFDGEAPAAGDAQADTTTENALNAYSQALEADESLATVNSLAQLYQQIGQADKAVELFREEIRRGQEEENWTPNRLARYYVGLGNLYQAGDNLDMARRAYQRAVLLDGWSAPARIRLAQVLSEQGDRGGALAEYRQAVEVAPGLVDAQVALADALDERGRQDEALALYQQAVQSYPGSVPANLALAEALQRRLDWSAAEERYRYAIEVVPGDVQTYVGLAGLYTAQGRQDDADAVLRQAIDLDQSYTPAYAGLGSLLARRGSYEKASDVYNKAIQISPSDWRLYAGLADVQLAIGQVQPALENLQRAAATNRSSPAPLLRLAAVYEQQGELERAEQALSQALLRSPGDVQVRIALAELYQAQGLNDEALIQFRRAIRDDAQSVEAMVALANELRRRGRTDDAEQLYSRAGSSGVATAAGYRSLALARNAQGQAEEALALIDRALELAPEEAANWLVKGQLLAQRADREGSLAAYRRATEITPGQARPWQALGEALLDAGQPESAIQAFDQAIAVEPGSLATYDSLAGAYQLLGQPEQVTATLEAARQAVPGSHVPYLFAATHLENQMQWEEAQVALQQAAEMAPGVTEVHLRQGALLARRGAFDQAITTYQSAVQSGLADWRLYMGMAGAYEAMGQLNEVPVALRRAAAVTVTSPEPLLQLAAFDRERNQPERAEQALLRALERFRGNWAVRSALAQLYQSLGRNDEALAQLRGAVEENPESIEAVVAYANALRLQDRGDEAQALYRQAGDLAAGQVSNARVLAEALQTQGRLSEALAVVEQAVSAAPGEASNWMARGQLEARLGDLSAAVASYEQATRLSPGQSRAWHAYGRALLTEGRTRDAVAALTTAIAVEPTYLAPYASLYDAYRAVGQGDEAAALVAQAQGLVPGSYLVDIYAARLLQDEQRWDEARQMLEQARAKAPGVLAPLVALAEMERLRGNDDQAIAAYEQAISLRPGDQVGYVALIDFYLSQGRNDQALAQVQHGLGRRPGDSELLVRLGRSQQAMGAFPEAEAAFIKAAGLSPFDSRARAGLANLYVVEGRPEKAIAAYQQALGIQPNLASYYLGIAQIWNSQGESQSAILALLEGLPRASRAGTLYSALSSIYLQQGKPDEAFQALQQGLQQEGEVSQILLALGSYYRNRAEFDLAEQTYLRAVDLYPGEFTAHAALGDLYLNRGRLAEAMTEYQTAVLLQANRPAVYLALGDIQSLTGNPEEATASYSQALALAPTQDDIYANLAALYEAQGKYGEARAVYDRGLAAIPSSTQLMTAYSTLQIQLGQIDEGLALMDRAVGLSPRATTLVARAGVYRELGRLDEAERDLQAALAVEPGSAQVLISLGDLHQARGDVQAARTAYQQAADLAPGLAAGYLGLADLANLQGRTDEAQRYYQAARTAEPASAEVMLRLAAARLSWGDLAGAESAYRGAVSLAPLGVEAYLGLAIVERQRSGDLERSLAYLVQAQRLGTEQAQVYRAIGDLYIAAGQSARALGYYKEAASREPNSPDGLLGLASYYSAVGLPSEAVRYAEQALQLSPRSPAVHIAAGDAYRRWGDLAAARSHYQSAINLAPAQPAGYSAAAEMYAAAGQHAEAIAAYEQAIRRAPLDGSLLVSLGNVYAQAGQFGQAHAAFARAIDINSGLVSAWLAKGDAYQLEGITSAAQSAFEQARALRPQDATPLLRLGGLALARADYGAAEGYARQAISLDSRSAAAYSMLGAAQAGLGQADAAIKSYQTAFQLDPRQIAAYRGWIRQHLGTDMRNPTIGRLQGALAAVANSGDSGSLWAQTLLGLGYLDLEGGSDRTVSHLERAIGLDPAFSDLYAGLATAYEGKMNTRLATSAWSRYVYSAGRSTDTAAAQARIAWLLKGRIEKPADGARVSGAVQIVGTAARDNFWYYKMEYSPAGSDAWVQIGEPIYQVVNHGQLLVWQTAGLAPGDYRLRLIVVDQTGNYGPYDEITLFVQ